MTKDEALRMALEALEYEPIGKTSGEKDLKDQAITAIKEALAQPEQDPFGYFRYDLRLDAWVQNKAGITGTPFYTTPPQREWVGLTSVDWNDFNAVKGSDPHYVAQWAEAKLKEKNT